MGLVTDGSNTLSVGGLSYDFGSHGAGVLVIYDDGTGTAAIDIRDGNDLAFLYFGAPLTTTVVQSYTVAPAASDRTATLAMFFGSVGGADRPNAIEITVDGVTTTLVDPLGSFDGDFWDTLSLPVSIPASVDDTIVTVQALSVDDGSSNLPASFTWTAATLSVPGEPPPTGDGCTPGFWKNHLSLWPASFSVDDDFDTVFGVDLFHPDITLNDAIRRRGGKKNKLARHGTAALLSAAHPDVDYALTVEEVIALVQAGDSETLVGFNELGCPIP